MIRRALFGILLIVGVSAQADVTRHPLPNNSTFPISMALIGVIALHIYFGLRLEKLFYTRSIIKGWISEEELKANHDPDEWPKDSA